MRWPIQIQLLLPTLAVVVAAIALTSATTAYYGARRATRQQDENLRRTVATLAEATFPLTERVLEQMKGLSGAEFVLLDEGGRCQAATLPVSDVELPLLGRVALEGSLEHLAVRPSVTVGGQNYRACRVPVAASRFAVEGGSLVVLSREDQAREAVRQAVLPAALVGLLSAGAAILVATILARRFVRPIQRLGEETARVASGVFLPFPLPSRNDEIRDLAVSIHRMTEKLSQYEADVRRNERLRTLGQLGAGIAHQLRNFATGARMAIELHQRECPQSADGESIGVALRQLRLMESYLHRFLNLGRAEPGGRGRVDLAMLVGEVLELVRPACDHAKIELRFERSAEPLVVWGERQSLGDLVMNLVLNGLEAARRGNGAIPRLEVALERSEQGKAVLRVMDTGPGPDAVDLERLFEPFATTKPEGAGLGLYVARQVAEAHRGAIGWDRRDAMTRFTVELPLMES